LSPLGRDNTRKHDLLARKGDAGSPAEAAVFLTISQVQRPKNHAPGRAQAGYRSGAGPGGLPGRERRQKSIFEVADFDLAQPTVRPSCELL